MRREVFAQRALDRLVGLGDGREIGLRLDDEVDGAEAVHGDRVGDLGELERQRETVCDVHERRAYAGGVPSD